MNQSANKSGGGARGYGYAGMHAGHAGASAAIGSVRPSPRRIGRWPRLPAGAGSRKISRVTQNLLVPSVPYLSWHITTICTAEDSDKE